MKWLTGLILSAVVIVTAVLVVRRIRRGRTVVLTGRLAPRVIRTAAIILVALGGAPEEVRQTADAAPLGGSAIPSREELPANISVSQIIRRIELARSESFRDDRRDLLMALEEAVPSKEVTARLWRNGGHWGRIFADTVKEDLEARSAGKPVPSVTPDKLLAIFNELESYGHYDHHLNAYLWRRAVASVDPKGTADWTAPFARIRQHARIADAVIRAESQVRPIMAAPRAWMSKAGPRGDERIQIQQYYGAMEELMKRLRIAYPETDEGLWKRDAIVLLKAADDAPTPVIVRSGKPRTLRTDGSLRVDRLDLLKTGNKASVIVHEWLGRVELPAGSTVCAARLSEHLSADARQKLDEIVIKALKDNSDESADLLETVLPFAAAAIRAGLKELPDTKGAPRMRMILAQFDEAVRPMAHGGISIHGIQIGQPVPITKEPRDSPLTPGGGPGGAPDDGRKPRESP